MPKHKRDDENVPRVGPYDIKRRIGAPMNVEGNSEGKMTENGDGGEVLKNAYDWSDAVRSTRLETVRKRHILSTSVLVGDDGKKGTYNTARTAELVFPVNIFEFWFASNIDSTTVYAPAVIGTAAFKIKSLRLRLSNLMIYEDTISLQGGTEIANSAANPNMYCIVQANKCDSVLPVYDLLSTANSTANGSDDESFTAPTVAHFIRGEIVNKTTYESMNIMEDLTFWRPGDPPLEFDIDCNKDVWLVAGSPVDNNVKQIPLNSLFAEKATGQVTFTHSLENYLSSIQLATNNTCDFIKIKLPAIHEADGKMKKFRLNMFVEQMAVVEKRNNWLQKVNATAYHNNSKCVLKTCAINDITALNPPFTSVDNQGFTPFLT